MGVKCYRGADMGPFLSTVAEFRMLHFRSYPYLYVGNLDYELRYLSAYAKNPDAMLLLLSDQNDEIQGLSTGQPLGADTDLVSHVAKSLQDLSLAAETFFYFGETILNQSVRGQGYYSKLVAHREDYARSLGYQWACFLTVERPPNHPLRPKSYDDPYKKFKHLDYQPTDLIMTYDWPSEQSSGQVKQETHPMRFWQKKL